MALPQNVQIPKSSQFAKLQMGANKFRILSDVITGWEGWKNNKPFRPRQYRQTTSNTGLRGEI